MGKDDLVTGRDVNSWKALLTMFDESPAGLGRLGEDSLRRQSDLANLWVGLNANKWGEIKNMKRKQKPTLKNS